MRHVVLEDHTGTIPPADLARAAAALNHQVDHLRSLWRHLPPAVVVVPSAPMASVGTPWPIRLVEKSSAGLGVHLDQHGHPYAEVTVDDAWTVTASHELLEMLVDPRGRRLDFGPVPDGGHGFRLVEVCDPVEARTYLVDDVEVSDFVGPAWYDGTGRAPGQYRDAWAGEVAPGQVLAGGYLSWIGFDGRWHQAFADGSGRVAVTSAGAVHPAGDLRAQKDAAFAGDG